VVFVDADNKIMATGFDPAEALEGSGLVRGDITAGRYLRGCSRTSTPGCPAA
jgi:hypothetical protein